VAILRARAGWTLPPRTYAGALSEGTLDGADFVGSTHHSCKEISHAIRNKAPTIKDMLAAVDAGTATLAEVGVVANDRLAREGKADGWYARYSALAAKCAAGEAVAVADVFPAKPDAAVSLLLPRLPCLHRTGKP